MYFPTNISSSRAKKKKKKFSCSAFTAKPSRSRKVKLTGICHSRLSTAILPTHVEARHVRIRIPSHARRKRSLALVRQLPRPHRRRDISLFNSPASRLSGPLVARLTRKQARIDNVVSQDAALDVILDQPRPVGCFLGDSGFHSAPLDGLGGPLGGRGRSLRLFNPEILLLLRVLYPNSMLVNEKRCKSTGMKYRGGGSHHSSSPVSLQEREHS